MNPLVARLCAWRKDAAALAVAMLMTSCSSSSSPQAPPSAPSGRCLGMLGKDAGPITASIRKKLGLPADLRGAVVSEVWPDGPATAAALRPNDVVEAIGDARIGNDCDFDDAAFNRSCGPVGVVVWRSGSRVEATLTAVDQATFFEKA